MFEIIKTGGWVMWPIILSSIAAMAIIGERLWSLQRKYVTPPQPDATSTAVAELR